MRAFFYRICGSGMVGAATLLKDAAWEVEGADVFFNPPMGVALRSLNIPLYNLKELDTNHLRSFDFIVVGNVVAKGSEDAQFLEGLGVELISFPQLLGKYILANKKVVGIAGTHGKTTTTAFMLQMFKQLKEEPGYLIGGVLNNMPSAHLGKGELFFIEADEYDSAYFAKKSKFCFYNICDLILTSLEFDHGDIFSNLEEIKDQFRTLLKTLKGQCISSSDYPASCELQKEFSHLPWQNYGEKSSLSPTDIEDSGGFTSFKVDGQLFKSNIRGRHNIFNLTATIIYALKQKKYSLQQIKKAVENLELPQRRQEVKGAYRGSIVIDDFAHHPTAIASTIDIIAKSYPQRPIVAVLALGTATARSSIFQDQYPTSLQQAKEVILLAPPSSTSISWSSDLDITALADSLKKNNIAVDTASTKEEILPLLRQRASKDKIILFLSNVGLVDSFLGGELR